MLPLGEPQRVAVGIVHVELATAPALVERAFVDRLRRVWIARRHEALLAELAKERVDIVGRDDDRLAEYAVSAMAGKVEAVGAPSDNAEARVVQRVITIHVLKVEHARVKRKRLAHVPATDRGDDCHGFHLVDSLLATAAAYTCVGPCMFERKITHLLSGVMVTFGSRR